MSCRCELKAGAETDRPLARSSQGSASNPTDTIGFVHCRMDHYRDDAPRFRGTLSSPERSTQGSQTTSSSAQSQTRQLALPKGIQRSGHRVIVRSMHQICSGYSKKDQAFDSWKTAGRAEAERSSSGSLRLVSRSKGPRRSFPCAPPGKAGAALPAPASACRNAPCGATIPTPRHVVPAAT